MPVIKEASDAMLAILIALPRMSMIFILVPIIGRGLVSGLVRTGIVGGMILFLHPLMMHELAVAGPIPRMTLFFVMFKEVLIGGLIGFGIGALFWGVQAAGFFIDNHRGAAIAGSVDPLAGTDTSPFGIAFNLAYTVYVFVSGGFLAFLGTIYSTYVLWPVFSFYPKLPIELTDFALAVGDQVMYLSLVFAGPVVIAMFLAEFGLALVSRFAPQLNVFILSMPVKSGVAMFMLVLYVPFLFSYLRDTFADRGTGLIDTLKQLIGG